MLAIVDTGPLYATVDADDDDHERCKDVLQDPKLRLVIPTLVIAEATYLVAARLGAKVEALFLRGLTDFDIQPPAASDWKRIGELVERYADLSLGGTDASVVTLAERLGTDLIITLDRRHFGTVRPKHKRALRLLP